MFSLVIISLLFRIVNADICERCVCDHKNPDGDVMGQNIDCSRQTVNNVTLPSAVHSLDMSWTNITVIPTLKSNVMAELVLNNNAITEISNTLNLPELKRLDLRNNKIEFIHEDVFRNMVKLEYLNLANNKINNFEKLAFHHLSNLAELILDNNAVGESLRAVNIFDRNGFGLTHKIKTLSISGVGLNKVPDNFFADAYNIKTLIIANNNLTDIFEIPYTLEYLDISDNPIKEIYPEDISDLPALRTLKLNNLQIKEIPDFLFSSLHGLVNLELERNKNLTKFSELAFGQEVLEDADDFILETLSLKGSRLSMLDEQLLEPFGQLVRLDLQGNPWKCDCNLVWLKKLQIKPNDYDHLRCGTPAPLFNSMIFELDDEYFVCPTQRGYTGLAIAVISLTSILSTAAVWLVVFLPRRHSRCAAIREMYAPSAAYTALSINVPIRDL